MLDLKKVAVFNDWKIASINYLSLPLTHIRGEWVFSLDFLLLFQFYAEYYVFLHSWFSINLLVMLILHFYHCRYECLHCLLFTSNGILDIKLFVILHWIFLWKSFYLSVWPLCHFIFNLRLGASRSRLVHFFYTWISKFKT